MGSLTNEIEADDGDEDVVELTYSRLKASQDAHGDWQKSARVAFDMVAGEQWTDEELADFREKKRLPIVFNRIARVVSSIAGNEVGQRQEVRYMPRTVGVAGVNELLTNAAEWARDQCDAEDEESDAFFDTIVCGMGWTETRMDYEQDPEGKVCIDRVDPLMMHWDDSAQKRNLADRKWQIHVGKMKLEDVKERWPEKADELTASTGLDSSALEDADVRIVDPNKFYQGERSAVADEQEVEVLHHQWYEVECYYKVLDPLTQQIQEVSEDEFPTLQERMQTIGMPLQSAKLNRRVYKRTFVCNHVELETGMAPSQKDFTFQAITGMRDRTRKTWYGIVKAMIDPQKFSNKTFSQMEFIIRSGAKGGLMVESGAAANPRNLEKQWAETASIVEFNEGALSAGKVMPKPAPEFPIAMQQMMDFSVQSLDAVSGVNLETLGMVGREQAGYLEAQRKQATLTILAPLFDSLRRYRKMQGRVLANFIQEYLSDGRLIRIVGKDGLEQYIPLLRDPQTMEYDVIVDEAPTSPNNKERTFAVLKEMFPLLQAAGVQPPPDTIKYLPLPESFIASIQKSMEEAKKNPPPNPIQMKAQADMQQAQMKMQADMQKLQMQLNQIMQLEQMRQQGKMQQIGMQAQSDIEQEKIRANSEIIQEQYRAGLEQQTELVTQNAQLQADVLMEQIRAAHAPKYTGHPIQ